MTARRQDVAAGGPATGAALAFTALGGRASVLTVLGHHPVAELVRADLAAIAVLDAAPADSDWVPPISAVRVSSAGRSVSSPDAALAPDPVAPLPDLPEVDVVLVDGHHPGLARHAAATANARGVPLVVDLGRPKPVFDELVPRSDVLVASADHRGEAAPLCARGPAAVAVTAGAGAIEWCTSEGSGRVEVTPTAAVDTLGAGDVFHGAVAHAVATLGLDAVVRRWPEVLAFAAAVAAVRVSVVGPHEWRHDPRLREVSL